MKNKDKYDLTKLTIKPKYMVTGCGKRLTRKYWINIYQDNKLIAKDVECKEHTLPALMSWLEEESLE